MYAQKTPVYSIQKFTNAAFDKEFYVNSAEEHLKSFQYVFPPHRHDHYMIMLCLSGEGIHHIDFIEYPIAGSKIFAIAPGQIHGITTKPGINGYVLMHSKEFYELRYSKKLSEFSFFCSTLNAQVQNISVDDKSTLEWIFKEMLREQTSSRNMKDAVLASLLDLLYIELTRLFENSLPATPPRQQYVDQLLQYENLVNDNYKTLKLTGGYAELMGITARHLNRICVSTVAKTASQIITDRIIVEAKRQLVYSGLPVETVAIELGYFDPSYFSRLFKKQVGMKPMEFIKHFSG